MIAAARFLALACHLGLLALLFTWAVWAPSPHYPVALVLLVSVGPLLLPLRGLLHARPYTHAWTAFLALYYFVIAVDDIAGATAPRGLAWAELALSVGLFSGCVVYARLEGRRRKAAAPKPG